MESYDTMRECCSSLLRTEQRSHYSVVGSFYALPSFQKQFGVHLGGEKYQLTAPIQTAFSESFVLLYCLGIN